MGPQPVRTLLLAVALTGAAAALADDPIPAKTFTLKQSNAKLAVVLDELTKQTGVTVDRQKAEPERTLNLNCDKVPFWQALEQIAKEADHRIVFAEYGKKVMLVGGENINYREMPVSFDGPYRLAARKVAATVDLDREQTVYEVTVDLHWEPGLRTFLVENPGKAVVARDNTDKELQVMAEGEGRLAVTGGGVGLTVRLLDVPRSAKTIKLLEGTFGIVGTPRMLTFEFADLGKDPKKILEQKQNEVTVKVRTDFKDGADLWAARVELEYPAGGPELESFESSAWLIDNQATLVSTDGKKKLDYNGGHELAAQSDRKATFVYRFTDEGNLKLGKPGDWKLVLKTPDRLVEKKVKFKLENIPLP